MRIPFGSVLLLGLLAATGCAVGGPGSPGSSSSSTTTTTTTSNPTAGSYVVSGNVHGGLAPVNGAHVYLMAVGTSGYGGASVSLLNGSVTTFSDSIGGYVTTNSTGAFFIPNTAFNCSSGEMTYLLATGGNAGAGTNSGTGMMAALGPCPTAALSANIWINEVSTIGTAYALGGFATDDVHISSSGTAAAVLGVKNAFSLIPNLYNPILGNALAATPNGNGAVPQRTINLLANILASCINSGSSTSIECRSLFSAASASISVTDTATAAILISHSPAANVPALFELQALGGQRFTPAAGDIPSSFILPITYTGGVLSSALGLSIDASGTLWVGSSSTGLRNAFNTAGVPVSTSGFTDGLTGSEYAVAIDNGGNIWGVDETANLLSEISPSGQIVGPTPFFASVQLANPFGLAFDHSGLLWVADDNGVTQVNPTTGKTVRAVPIPSTYGDGIADVEVDGLGNAWATNFDNNTLVKLTPTGVPVFGIAGVGGGGLHSPQGIAFDSQNNVWVGNANGTSVSKFSTSGYPLSPTGFFGAGVAGSRYVAIDGTGHVWTPASSSGVIGEFDNAGNPLTPTGFLAEPSGLGFWAIAIDGSGNVWTTSTDGALIQLVGAAAPVITPLTTASRNNTLGTRP